MNNQEIKECIKESKYKITLKEWNFIKKQVKEIAKKYNIQVKFYKKGKETEIILKVGLDFLNIPSTLLNAMENKYATIKANEKYDLLLKEVNEIVERHDVCYSERELLTDYYGLYRLSNYSHIEFDNQSLSSIEEVAKKLVKIEGCSNSFSHLNYNKLAKEVNLPLI